MGRYLWSGIRGFTFEGVGRGLLFAPPSPALQHTVHRGQQLRLFFCRVDNGEGGGAMES